MHSLSYKYVTRSAADPFGSFQLSQNIFEIGCVLRQSVKAKSKSIYHEERSIENARIPVNRIPHSQ
jgi:hypothetical protein